MNATYSAVSRLSRWSNEDADAPDDDFERPHKPGACSWCMKSVVVVLCSTTVVLGGALVAGAHAGVLPARLHGLQHRIVRLTTPGGARKHPRSHASPPAAINRTEISILTIQSTLSGSMMRTLRSGRPRLLAPHTRITSLTHTYGNRTDGCYLPAEAPAARHGLVRATMLRAPRSHVLNLYLACRLSAVPPSTKKGAQVLKSRNASSHDELRADRAFPGASAVAVGAAQFMVLTSHLRRWLSHFNPGSWQPSNGDWHCVHPSSLQARAFTCAQAPRGGASARHVMNPDFATPPIRPTGGSGEVDAMKSLDVVGVAELFHESVCLITLTAKVRPPPAHCNCRLHPPARNASAKTHAKPPAARSTGVGAWEAGVMAAMPADILQRIDGLTANDARLYLAASTRLVASLRQMEETLHAEGYANFTLLCDDRLASYQKETSYLGAMALRQAWGDLLPLSG